MKHVVVVGGGVSGLAAAHALRAHAPPDRLALTVLEASGRFGGKVQTERTGGYVLERGPDLFLTRKPEVADLCRVLGLGLQPTRPQPRRTYVLRGGRLFEMPEGLTGLVPSRVLPLLRSPLLSVRGRLRVLCEPFVPAWRGEDPTVARFLCRRIGAEAYASLVAPLLAGVYGDGHVLSTGATVPELRAMEQRHGSLARAFLAQRRGAAKAAPARPAGAAFASLAGGLQALPEALQAALPDAALRPGVPVHGVRGRGGAYEVATDSETIRADAVVVALPANAAAPLLAGLDADLGAALAAIPHESLATATLAFAAADVPVPLDAHGYLVPAPEGRPVRAVTWSTAKFDGRAPDGTALFRLFFADPGAVDAPDDVLVGQAVDELARTLGIRGAPLLARVVRWHHALPRYTLGHLDRVAAVEAALRKHAGVFVAGPSLRGAGLPDSVRMARTAARAALSHLHLA